ncbi:M56 family metallopeptidase [Longimicrobium sp.]|uniref:M56 family metallopeptidase n=1 Tax=Longimicrobium sp. TaxID=2029185 RepID=UPI002B7A1FA5|nr:M56 family metallopeptidase [Longimicrobium sp.]HSU15788.1 M56 family metallopeptidase [Longimicrobium sp.]
MSALQLASVFAVLADAAAKGTLVLVAALAATRLMRRRSAAARHLVWVVALASMLALPAVTRLLPAWRVVPVPAPLRPAAAFVASPATASSPIAAAHPRADASASTAAHPASPVGAGPAAAGAVSPSSSSSPSLSSSSPATPFDWKTALMAVWCAGGVLLVLRLGYGLGRVWWMERRATEITDEGWVRIADRLARRLRVGRVVTLLREAHAVVPMTWGIVRPVVLLPAEAEDWDEERRTVVLAHELAHVRRWDPLTQWIAHLSLALFWFHPLVWMAARRMREEREHACDDAVLSIGTRPVAYADHLLDIVRSLGQAEGPAAALAMARRSQFEGRLLAILDGATARGGVSRGLGFAALVVAAAAVVPLAALRVAEPHAAAGTPAAALVSGVPAPAVMPEARPKGVVARIAGNVREMLDRALPAGGAAPAGSPAPPAPASAATGGTAAAPVPNAPAAAAGATAGGVQEFNEKVTYFARELNVPPAKMAEMLQEGGGYADVIRAADGIASSGDKAAVLLAVLRRPDVGTGDLALLLRSASTIGSSGDRGSVLKEFTRRYPLQPASVRTAFFGAARTMSSGDQREVLLAVLARAGEQPEAVSGVISSTAAMASGGDRRDVLLAVLSRPSLGAAQLVEVVGATGAIPSSGDRRDILLHVVSRPGLPREALTAALNASASIPSSGDRRDVLLAAASRQRVEGSARDAYLAAARPIADSGDRAMALSALLGPAAAAQPAASAAGSQTTTTTIHDHDSDGVWNSDISLTSDDGRHVTITSRDVVRGSDAADIREIRRGGRLVVEETRNGITRRAEMVPTASGPRGTYTVAGRAVAFEPEGRAWMARILREFTQ